MRRVLTILVPAVALGALGLSAVASAHDDGEHLHFVAEFTSVETSDVGSGQQAVMTFDVFEHHHEGETSAQDHDGAERAGHGVATCVTADREQGALCSGSVELADGKLSSSGIVHHHSDPNGVTLPVVGGSGRFFGASGQVELTYRGDSDGHDHSPSGSLEPAEHHESEMGRQLHLAFHLK